MNYKDVKKEMQTLHKLSSSSPQKLQNAYTLGCFSCISQFTYDDLNQSVKSQNPARCPYCGTNAVIPLTEIPNNYRKPMLETMKTYYFT